MSGPVVLIGYILLIPSIIGMVCALLIIIGTLGFSGAVATAPVLASQVSSKASQAESNVAAFAGLNRGCRAAVFEPALLASDDSVHEEYIDALNHRSTQRSPKPAGMIAAGVVGGTLAATIGIGFGVAVLISFFVGGLLGWLLVMKKKVLQCSLCQATVSAS